jgi:transcriptional regulator with XRE-family HTH domain
MDDRGLGNAIRLARVRGRLRQADVARRARVSRQLVGRLERGLTGRYPLDTVRAVASALGMSIEVRVRWQGADLDRLVNAAHASLHESVARQLGTLSGWAWRPEVTFAWYGERGRHRHPGLACRVSELAHHRAQVRARRPTGPRGHDASANAPRSADRAWTGLGPHDRERLGHRARHLDGAPSRRTTRAPPARGVPSRGTDDARLAPASTRDDLGPVLLVGCHARWP